MQPGSFIRARPAHGIPGPVPPGLWPDGRARPCRVPPARRSAPLRPESSLPHSGGTGRSALSSVTSLSGQGSRMISPGCRLTPPKPATVSLFTNIEQWALTQCRINDLVVIQILAKQKTEQLGKSVSASEKDRVAPRLSPAFTCAVAISLSASARLSASLKLRTVFSASPAPPSGWR